MHQHLIYTVQYVVVESRLYKASVLWFPGRVIMFPSLMWTLYIPTSEFQCLFGPSSLDLQFIVTMGHRRSFSSATGTLAGNYINFSTGARFTNGFLPAIQIRWKLRLAVIPLLAIRSRQIFAHATTAQLSCHVQNFVTIALLDSRWEWNEISIEFEMWWKNR